MPRYFAFLRAINVGGHVVKMDQLRALFEALRFRNVETFIASGNVLFDSRSGDASVLEGRIEKHLERALRYGVTTFVRTPSELAATATYRPFGTPDPLDLGHSLYVGFLKAVPSAEGCARLLGFGTAVDDFHVHEREFYWRCRTTLSESKVTGAQLERAVGPVTLRNVTTVRRLAQRPAVPT